MTKTSTKQRIEHVNGFFRILAIKTGYHMINLAFFGLLESQEAENPLYCENYSKKPCDQQAYHRCKISLPI